MKHLATKPFRKLLLFTLIIFSACCANAQTSTGSGEARTASKGAVSYIDSFFKKYKTNPDSAVDYLFGTNKLFTNTSQLNLLKSKLDSLQLSVGKYLGKELITQKNVSTSLVLYSYLVKHENQPMRFTFMFYKPKNDWVLYRFNYDDQLDIELLEAAKISNKKQ